MKFKFTGKFKSLNDFESCEIGDFCVLTGKNGAGKTQLIYVISNNSNRLQHVLHIYPTVHKIRAIALSKGSALPIKIEEYNKRITTIINQYNTLKTTLPLAKLLMDKGLNDLILTDDNLRKAFGTTTDVLYEVLGQVKNIPPHSNYRPANDQQLYSNVLHFISPNRTQLLIFFQVSEYFQVKVEALDITHFQNFPFDERALETGGFLDSQIEYIFFNYAKRRRQNKYDNFSMKEDGEMNNSISDSEFSKLNPAPWTILNQLLHENGMNYSFPEVKFTNAFGLTDMQTFLIKTESNERIELQDLSSGEKVIMDLIIKLFTASYYDNKLELPDLLVLDEPDAHLHPEMAKLLIKVLYETFVLKYGIKVIMTTHSPSTIALAPEDCIYEIKNSPSCSLQKIRKDDALKMLTGNIPTLSIDYKNHRQIFVESPRDIYYYQTIFTKIKQETLPLFNLYFISNSLGTGNCDQVIKTITQLRNSGVITCFGLIDWDSTNTNTKEVVVHGENKRYSLENYLLDPLYLAAFLLQRGANNIKNELSFGNAYNEFSFEKEGDKRLQEISNWVIQKIYIRFPDLKKGNDNKIIVEYYNHKKILLPRWYVEIQGHELEEKLGQCFEVVEVLRKSGLLHKTMTEVVGKCFPLIPSDTVETLNSIQILASQ